MPTPRTSATARPVGEHLRAWRRRRRLSQLAFALDAEISQKHLSFIESGRAAPSRAMVLRLAENLRVPLRDRNAMLLAAGYAPAFPERPLADPELAPARRAIERLLKAHEPYPALAIDRRWEMAAANAAVPLLLSEVREPSLLAPPVNVLRLSLHPGGLAPAILDLPAWRAHVLERLRGQVDATGDAALASLLAELAALPCPDGAPAGEGAPESVAPLLVPFRLRVGGRTLSFLTTTTVFGAPLDVTVAELAIESFFPADEATAAALRDAAEARLAPSSPPV